MDKGIVKRVIGPVVDVHFPAGQLPEIYHAVEVPLEDHKVVMEVVQQVGGGDVRCIALASTDGISRGCEAVNTGTSITMPVGEATLGRMFNVVGEPIDGKGPVETADRLPIHRKPPVFTDILPATELLETGIKVIDLLAPYSKGGKVRRIYFPEKLCGEMLSWLALRGIRSGFVFTNRQGKQITPRGISSQLKVLARHYRISPDTVYPHSFRHRFAKNFLSKFNDISLLADLMGHESIETTRIYLTRSSDEQRVLIDKIVTW